MKTGSVLAGDKFIITSSLLGVGFKLDAGVSFQKAGFS